MFAQVPLLLEELLMHSDANFRIVKIHLMFFTSLITSFIAVDCCCTLP